MIFIPWDAPLVPVGPDQVQLGPKGQRPNPPPPDTTDPGF